MGEALAGRRRWIWLAVVVVVLALIGYGVAHALTAGASEKPRAAATAAADRGPVSTEVGTTGTVQPAQTRTLSFTVAGTVESVSVRPGSQVQAGQTLAKVDDTGARKAVDDAQDALDEAQQQLTDARTRSAEQTQAARSDTTGCAAPVAYTVPAAVSVVPVSVVPVSIVPVSSRPASSRPTTTPTGSASPAPGASTGTGAGTGTGGGAATGAGTGTGRGTGGGTGSGAGAGTGSGTRAGETGDAGITCGRTGSSGSGTTGQRDGGSGTTGQQGGGSGSGRQGGGSGGGDVGSSGEQGGGSDAVLSAQQRVVSADTTLANAEDALEGATITAPIAGRVLSVGGKVGSQVNAGSTFITLAGTSDMQIDADFPEADADNLKVGQTASVTLADADGKTFKATVVEVDPTGTSDGTMVRYGVQLAFDASARPANLLVGQSATVAVTTGSKADVLRVPSTAVHDVAGPTGTVLRDGARVEVGIGLRGDQYTEITSGLGEGDQVVRSW